MAPERKPVGGRRELPMPFQIVRFIEVGPNRLEIEATLIYRLDLGKNRAETIHDGLCIDCRGGYL